MISVWILNGWFIFRILNPLVRKYVPPSERRWPTVIIGSLALTNLLVQVTNLLGFIWTPNPEAYIFGLLLFLVSAGCFFTYIILDRPDEDNNQEEHTDTKAGT